MTFKTGRKKITDRLLELGEFCESGSPWVFVCATALIEYLGHLALPEAGNAEAFRSFVTRWMSQVRPEYKAFQYRSGKSDLPDQLYFVLRCGLVHSLSLIPDAQSTARGGRQRSVVLCHRPESRAMRLRHLTRYRTQQITDAVVLVAEDFVSDIRRAADRLFERARKDSGLRAGIERQMRDHPLLSGGY